MNPYKLFLLALGILFISCGKESFEEEILGNWQVEAYRIDDCDDPSSELPWTNTTRNECLVTPTLEVFKCIVSVNIKSDSTATLTVNNRGDLFEEENFIRIAVEKVYICLNRDDDNDVCDSATLEDGKLIYEVANIGGQDCPEDYRLTKN